MMEQQENNNELVEGSMFLESLLSFIDQTEVEENDITETDAFKIETNEQANYIARKLHELRLERAEAESIAKAQLTAYKEKVDKWLKSVSSPLDYQEARYLGLLQTFAQERLEGSTKRSIKLIEGTLQFRSQGDKFEYDDKALLAFAELELKDYLKLAPSVDKAALKKEVTVKDGRAFLKDMEVPGITVTPMPDKFDLK